MDQIQIPDLPIHPKTLETFKKLCACLIQPLKLNDKTFVPVVQNMKTLGQLPTVLDPITQSPRLDVRGTRADGQPDFRFTLGLLSPQAMEVNGQRIVMVMGFMLIYITPDGRRVPFPTFVASPQGLFVGCEGIFDINTTSGDGVVADIDILTAYRDVLDDDALALFSDMLDGLAIPEDTKAEEICEQVKTALGFFHPELLPLHENVLPVVRKLLDLLDQGLQPDAASAETFRAHFEESQLPVSEDAPEEEATPPADDANDAAPAEGDDPAGNIFADGPTTIDVDLAIQKALKNMPGVKISLYAEADQDKTCALSVSAEVTLNSKDSATGMEIFIDFGSQFYDVAFIASAMALYVNAEDPNEHASFLDEDDLQAFVLNKIELPHEVHARQKTVLKNFLEALAPYTAADPACDALRLKALSIFNTFDTDDISVC